MLCERVESYPERG